jgi:hypothetical protein
MRYKIPPSEPLSQIRLMRSTDTNPPNISVATPPTARPNKPVRDVTSSRNDFPSGSSHAHLSLVRAPLDPPCTPKIDIDIADGDDHHMHHYQSHTHTQVQRTYRSLPILILSVQSLPEERIEIRTLMECGGSSSFDVALYLIRMPRLFTQIVCYSTVYTSRTLCSVFVHSISRWKKEGTWHEQQIIHVGATF